MPDLFEPDRTEAIGRVLPPIAFHEELPLSPLARRFVGASRRACAAILEGQDDRLLVITGPCSMHDVAAGREYAERVAQARRRHGADLEIVMRVYCEKPRTRTGWKGLINDPLIDGSCHIDRGIRVARGFLVEVAERGVPAAVEYLGTITPQFISDCVVWGSIGARTTESQLHREMASGLSGPVGFKNGTDGSIRPAIDAIHAARSPHSFLAISREGVTSVVRTKGNALGHLVLRGGTGGPNHDRDSIAASARALADSGLPTRLVVDCSHGNAQNDYRRQIDVASDVGEQVAGGSVHVCGVMLESHLREGRQPAGPLEQLEYGKSITDGCISWESTCGVLERLAGAVRERRCLCGGA